MKKTLLALLMVLFTSCIPVKARDGYRKSYLEKEIDTFINMELGDEEWLFWNIHVLRVPGGWVIERDGLCFVPYSETEKDPLSHFLERR